MADIEKVVPIVWNVDDEIEWIAEKIRGAVIEDWCDVIKAWIETPAIRAHILQSAWLKVGEHMPRPSQELLLLERGRDGAGRLFANQYFAELSTDGSAFLDPHNYEPIVALNNPNYELFWQPLPLPPTGGNDNG